MLHSTLMTLDYRDWSGIVLSFTWLECTHMHTERERNYEIVFSFVADCHRDNEL